MPKPKRILPRRVCGSSAYLLSGDYRKLDKKDWVRPTSGKLRKAFVRNIQWGGKVNEDKARVWVTEKLPGSRIENTNRKYEYTNQAIHLICKPDGVICDEPVPGMKRRRVLEIKCPNCVRNKSVRVNAGVIPFLARVHSSILKYDFVSKCGKWRLRQDNVQGVKYWHQLQGEMYALDVTEAVLCIWSGKNGLMISFNKDPCWIEGLLQKRHGCHTDDIISVCAEEKNPHNSKEDDQTETGKEEAGKEEEAINKKTNWASIASAPPKPTIRRQFCTPRWTGTCDRLTPSNGVNSGDREETKETEVEEVNSSLENRACGPPICPTSRPFAYGRLRRRYTGRCSDSCQELNDA